MAPRSHSFSEVLSLRTEPRRNLARLPASFLNECAPADLPNSFAGRGGDFFQLRQVVQVVAGHGFHKGEERHGSPLGVGHRAICCPWHRFADQRQVPPAQRTKNAERFTGTDPSITGRPLVLIEWLNRRCIFGQRLAQAEGKDQLAIGQMRNDLRSRPFLRRGPERTRQGWQ